MIVGHDFVEVVAEPVAVTLGGGMKFYVDFSLYASPNYPYANVTGYVERPHTPYVGELLVLIDESASGPALVLPVAAVRDSVALGAGSVWLEDYVLDGIEMAEEIGRRLDAETKLLVYVYGASD